MQIAVQGPAHEQQVSWPVCIWQLRYRAGKGHICPKQVQAQGCQGYGKRTALSASAADDSGRHGSKGQ